LHFEALLTAARQSPNLWDFALVATLGLLGLRIFEATGADIGDLGEEHGHRVLRVCGKGTKVVLVPLPRAVERTIDRAVGDRTRGPVLLNSRGARIDRHAATLRLYRHAEAAGIQVIRAHPHMLRHIRHDHARCRHRPPRRPERRQSTDLLMTAVDECSERVEAGTAVMLSCRAQVGGDQGLTSRMHYCLVMYY
jgi:integrase